MINTFYKLQTKCMAEKNGPTVLILHNELFIGSVASGLGADFSRT